MAADAIPLPIVPPPGVIKTESRHAAQGRWLDSDAIRFVKGRPQKRGGHTKATTTAASGTIRAMHCWRDLSFDGFIAAGTYRKLYVYDTVFAQNDITPYRDTGTLGNNPFSVASGSAVVTVTDTAHGLGVGDTAIFAGSSAVGGITPNGTFIVTQIVDADHYKFSFTSNASSTTTGGGAAVTYKYEIPVGVEISTFGYGWGVGGWGLGTWGTARSSSTVSIEPRVWSLDHFGKILLSSYNGGSVYTFDPSVAQPWPRAAVIADAPDDCRAMFVTPERYVFALRSDMTVSWCKQGDYTVWTPADDNDANTRTLTEGTKLVAGRVLGPFISLVWTDAAVYPFTYTGSQYVYNSKLAGKNCGLVAAGAAVTVGGVAYWMGPDQFWMYDGSVQPMSNVEDIRRYVYDNLSTQNAYQCEAVYVPAFNEIRFFWTSMGQTNPDKCICYSISDRCWYPDNSLNRVSGDHFTQQDARPYMAAADGYIYLHEDTNDADGVSIPWSLTLAPYAMSNGMRSMDLSGIEFDFLDQSGDIDITVNAYDRLPRGTAAPTIIDTDTATVDDGDELTDLRVSGRYLELILECDEVDSYMRWGAPTAFVTPAGARR